MRAGPPRCNAAVRAVLGALIVTAASAVGSGIGRAQAALAPLTRAGAIDAAERRGLRGAFAREDSLVAHAELEAARGYPNPVADLTYSRAVPLYHGVLSLPVDYPWVRGARVRAAELGLRSAAYRYAFERALVQYDADTAYTRALAAAGHAALSHQNAIDADSLRQLAGVRRDAGDASDLDVDLATINAGQAANASAADSVAATGALFDLQSVLGLPSDHAEVTLADSLAMPDASPTGRSSAQASGRSAQPLPVAAAAAAAEAGESALALAHRSVLAQPSIQAGLEGGDPEQPYLMPTIGVSLPIPLFNRDRGEIALATAARDRARLELEEARRESAAAIARAERELTAALTRARRDSTLLDAAHRVAARSLVAFAEGASGLASVIEAQRSARDATGQYLDDLAAANTAAATARLAGLTAETP
jgi:cobalt-zinc-cadmium efflux system outer membrane protein